MSFPRYLEKFVSADTVYSYTFPTRQYTASFDQPLRNSQVVIAGANYPFDQLGVKPGPKSGMNAGHDMVVMGATGLAVDTEYLSMRNKLYKAGLGKLYLKDEAAVEVWCWARLAAMPTTSWTIGDDRTLRVSLSWAIVSDFMITTPFDHTETFNSDPDTVVINNPGTARVYDAILTLKGPFTNPVILNQTNGYQIATTRDGSGATKWLEIRAGRPSVRYSANSGVTYVGDYAFVTLPNSQVQLMVIEPGNNTFQVTGANGADFRVQFDPPLE